MLPIPTRNLRVQYIGAGPLLAALAISAGILCASWPLIQGHDIFPDPVASNIAWGNIYKTKDFITLAVGLGLVLGLSVLITCLCSWIAAGREEMKSPLNDLLLVSLIPVVWRVALACSMPNTDMPPLVFFGCFPLVAVISIVLMGRHRRTLEAGQILNIGGAIAIGLLLAGFAGLALLTGICRVIHPLASHLTNWDPIFALISLGAFAGFVLYACWRSVDAGALERQLVRGVKWVQLALPLLFYHMLPPVLIDPQHRIFEPYPIVLAITLTILAGVAWYFIWRRIQTVTTLATSVAPISVALLVMFIYCGSTGMPAPQRDYFHIGEQVVPWQQLWDFHSRPYVDFVPVHGLMAMMRGAFSQFFFDGTIASYDACDVLLTGVAAIAIGLTMAWLTGSIGALFLLLGYFPYLDRMYFFVPSLFIVSNASLLKKPARLLVVWMVLCFLMIAYNASMGPAFAAGTLPVALWLVYRLIRNGKSQLIGIVLGLTILGTLAWVIHPIREMGFAFIHFMTGNAWSNEIAHGIGWSEGYDQRVIREGPGSSQFLFEIVRCAWAPVAVLALGMFWAELGKKREDRRASLLALAGTAPLAMLLTVPWILGRMTGGSLDKTGSLAHAAIYMVLPALVLLYVPRRSLMPALLVVAGVIGYLYACNPACADPERFLVIASRIRVVPDDAKVIDGSAIGLPHLGKVIEPTTKFHPDAVGMIDDLLTLKRDLKEFLRPGETYIDLTNQTLLYYYLDLRCPTRYAPFVAANSRLQSGELQQLRDHPEPVMLIWPAGWTDDITVEMRCYELYREYVQKFVAVQRDQYIFLVDPSRLEHPPVIGSPEQIALIEPWMSETNLKRLPLSWGESWSHMRDRFDSVAPVAVDAPVFRNGVESRNGKMFFSGASPYWEYTIPPAVKDGATADFLRIQYEDEPTNPVDRRFALAQPASAPGTGTEPAMTCRWIGSDGRDSEAISFKAGNGNIILPLGAYPRWLLGKAPQRLRFDFQNPWCVKWMRISGMEFLHLKTLPAN
jgi:hypothetical protein